MALAGHKSTKQCGGTAASQRFSAIVLLQVVVVVVPVAMMLRGTMGVTAVLVVVVALARYRVPGLAVWELPARATTVVTGTL